MKKKGVFIVALEQDSKAVDYKKLKVKSSVALVLGSEVNGISKKVLKISDAIIDIPMRGKKESLNVSVATGIVLFDSFYR